MRFTLTPGAGSNSKVVITGPGPHRDDLAVDAEVGELVSRMRELASSASSSIGCVVFDRRVEEAERRQPVGVLGEQLLLRSSRFALLRRLAACAPARG